MVDIFVEYIIPIVTASVFTALVGVSLFQLLNVRRNMRSEGEYHIYSRIIRARIELENTIAFTEMAKESPEFAYRFARIGNNPQQYYTAVAFFDLLELLFRYHETKTMDPQLWPRWRELAKTLMTIPKFRIVWENTKYVHTKEFIQFIDSVQ
jgi:hypothetical protein